MTMSTIKEKCFFFLVFETPEESYVNGGFQDEGRKVKKDEK